MVKLIDFESKRRERDYQKRCDDIEAMVQFGQHELFDEWIAKEEKMLTDKRTSDCKSYIQFLGETGCDPSDVFQEVIFLDPDDFMATFGVDWLEAIEAALTYYAVLRKHQKSHYDITLLAHPFIGVV